jgi:hypothetical protein
MADFIGNAPATQLLILMALPLTIAVLLGAFIGFSLRQRRKSSQMKLGIIPKQAPSATQAELQAQARTVVAVPPKVTAPPPLTETPFNLGIQSQPSPVKKEDIPMAEIPQPSSSEPINLAARLGRQEATPPRPAPASSEPVELLRLLRQPGSGQLVVEVAGQRYTKLADVTDKKIGQYILKLVAHLLVFTNGVILTSAGMKSLAAPKMDDVPEPILPAQREATPKIPPAPPAPPPPVAPVPPLPDAEATLLAALKTSSPAPTPPPKRGLFGRAIPVPPVPNLPGLNLAEEINEIVQARLRYSHLAQNRIEITSDPRGGIRIQVNNKFYSSPDEVEEPEIRELIKASIKEWERK